MSLGLDPETLLSLLVSHAGPSQRLQSTLGAPRTSGQSIPMGRTGGLGMLPVGMGDDSLSPQVADAQEGSQDAAFGPPAPFDPSSNPPVPGLTLDPRTGMYAPVLRQSAHPGWEAAAAGARQALAGASFTSPYAGAGANLIGGLLGGVLQGGSGVLAGQAATRQAENDAATKQANELNTETTKNLHAQELARVRWDAHRAAMQGENAPTGATAMSGKGVGKSGTGGWTSDDQAIGDRMIRGEFAPTTLGGRITQYNRGVVNYLASKGYNWQDAQKRYAADLRAVSALNGPQQLRLRQAIDSVSNTLDAIDTGINEVASTMPRTNSTWMNQGLDALAKQGALGDDAKNALQGFTSRVTMSTDELANVLSSGGVPSDKALALAAQALDKHGSVASIQRATQEIRFLLSTRKAALGETGAQGLPSSQFPGAPVAPKGDLGMVKKSPLDAFVRH